MEIVLIIFFTYSSTPLFLILLMQSNSFCHIDANQELYQPNRPIGWPLATDTNKNRITTQGPVVQRVDNAIHRVRRYPVDK